MKTLGGVVLAAALALTLTLTACSNTDERINSAVKERLAGEPTPLVQLEVSTKDRIVRLNGVVHDERERERLERIVRDMDDVLGVDNRLTIARAVQTTGEGR
jgi:osmotically-inducible protein OsmY